MAMSALQRKLWRELGRLRAQIATIAVVLAGGVSCFVALRGNYEALHQALTNYYDTHRFAHVFARVERAPQSLARRIERLPGVEQVQTRIEQTVSLPIEGMARPASAQLLSLPSVHERAINALSLRSGRLPEPGRADEVVVLEAFAEAHGVQPGQTLPAVLAGKLRQLRIVGTVLSPEFIYAIRPGAMVDDPKAHTVMWMDPGALAATFQLANAFNAVVLRTSEDANEAALLAKLDRLLKAYGGTSAIGRKDQISHHIVTGELDQLSALAGMVPLVFLAVVAFLVNLVLGRFIALQRSEIAALKALGYSNSEVGVHYMGLVAVVLTPGLALGAAGGWYLGSVVLRAYSKVFRLPDLGFQLSWQLLGFALLVSTVAAGSGAWFAVRTAVNLPPAEAMRAPAPAHHRASWLEQVGLAALLGPNSMMVVRELTRRPLRTLLSSLGVAGAVALSILGRFGWDSFNDYFEGTFQRAQRQDLSVSFSGATSPRAVRQVLGLPGVLVAEGQPIVGVRVRFGHRQRNSVLIGMDGHASLRQLVQRDGSVVALPNDGIAVSSMLAEILDAKVGDRLELELYEGHHRVVRPIIASLVDEAIGLQLYADSRLLAELERDNGAVSTILMRIASGDLGSVAQRFKRYPNVLDVSDLNGDMQRLLDMNASIMNIWTSVSVLLASGVIFGVVYNNARVALAVRARELASLRVLGFTRGEVGRVLLGALAVEVLVAIPIGLWLGTRWAEAFMANMDPETFRWAVVVAPSTYALSAAVALLAAAASTLWIQSSLEKLDLIGVLKTHE